MDIEKQGTIFREEYYQSIKTFVQNLQPTKEIKEIKTIKDILGFPLDVERTLIKERVKKLLLEKEEYSIFQVQLETDLDIKIYGLMSIPKTISQKAPAVIVQHGGGGAPEEIFGLCGENVYKSIGDYIANEGVVVFAPQVLLWNKSEYGTSFEREDRLVFDDKLKEIGGSITALEVHCIQAVIDYLRAIDIVDKDRIGMLGMSYGGMYTLFSMAIDSRIKVGYSSSWFNDRVKYPWKDWTYLKDTPRDWQVVKEIYPRKIFIEVGDHDEMFDAESARAEFEILKHNFDKTNEFCSFNVYNGNHSINDDKTYINLFIQKLFAIKGEEI